MKNCSLTKVVWSPDSKYVLIATSDLDVHLFDYLGNFIKKSSLIVMQSLYGKSYGFRNYPEMVNLLWTRPTKKQHSLLFAFKEGHVQLMKNEMDTDPIIFNTEIELTSAEMSFDCDLIAVTGQYWK